MPAPLVKRGSKVKLRRRRKDGKWRKKRSDTGSSRRKPILEEGTLQGSLPVGDAGREGKDQVGEEVDEKDKTNTYQLFSSNYEERDK